MEVLEEEAGTVTTPLLTVKRKKRRAYGYNYPSSDIHPFIFKQRSFAYRFQKAVKMKQKKKRQQSQGEEEEEEDERSEEELGEARAKPEPPEKPDTASLEQQVREKAAKIRRKPGEPVLVPELTVSCAVTPNEQCPR